MHSKLDMSQQRTPSKSITSRSRDVIISLYLVSLRPYLQYSSVIPQLKRDIENLERVHQKIAKMIRGLKKLKDAGTVFFFSAF